MDRILAGAGLEIDPDAAFFEQVATGLPGGARSFGTFSWSAPGLWRAHLPPALGRGTFEWTLFGAVGLDYDARDGSPGARIGAISGLNGVAYADPAVLSELYWRQAASDGRWSLLAGRVDLTYHFDESRVANDELRHFTGGALANSPSIPFPVYGGLGAVARAALGKGAYVALGVADASSHEPFAVWQTADQGDWIQLLELGATLELPRLGAGTWRVQPWHSHLRRADGFGLAIHVEQELGAPHRIGGLRLGIGDASVTPVKRFASGALALDAPFGRPGDRIGLGVAWSDPSRRAGARDETLLELSYRVRLTPSVELTPSVQLLVHPARNTREDLVVVPGLLLLLDL